MRLEKCYFCSANIYPGHGITFVRNDSKVFNFCRSKCHKNFKLKRNPRKVRWTKSFRKAHGKELQADSVFEFERRRHVATRYDRDLMQSTLNAMRRVGEVKERREGVFYDTRMRDARKKQVVADLKEIKQNIELAKPALSKVALLNKTRVEETLSNKEGAAASSSSSSAQSSSADDMDL